MTTLPRLARARASDSVFDVLRESILTRVFSPGDRLDVRALADQLGVSPTPVKDAINRLASEGLIDVRPRSGTFVAEITPDAVAETFEIRRALECLAAETLAERLTPELLQRFTRVMDELERPIKTDADRTKHERANVALHALIVEGAGNRRLQEIYKSLNAHLTIARIHSRRRPDAARLEQEQREHRAILSAIQLRDTEGLVQLLGQHIRRAGRALVDDVLHARGAEQTVDQQVEKAAQKDRA
jgi:DNA-binding GntR family transcriptional regulator